MLGQAKPGGQGVHVVAPALLYVPREKYSSRHQQCFHLTRDEVIIQIQPPLPPQQNIFQTLQKCVEIFTCRTKLFMKTLIYFNNYMYHKYRYNVHTCCTWYGITGGCRTLGSRWALTAAHRINPCCILSHWTSLRKSATICTGITNWTVVTFCSSTK